MKVTQGLRGQDELARNLLALAKDFSGATARNAAKRGMVEAAEPTVVDAAKTKAHRRSGQLADGIVASPRLKSSAGDKAYAAALRGGASKADAVQAKRDVQRALKGTVPPLVIFVGVAGPAASRAHLEEFGVKPHLIRPAKDRGPLHWPGDGGDGVFAGAVRHPGHAPHPFLRPALEEQQAAFFALLAPKIGAQVEASARRAAKRKAKAAERAFNQIGF